MAARGVATSQPASTSPAVTSHRRAAMARCPARGRDAQPPSAWRRCAGAGATRMHRSPPRWSAPGHHAPPRRPRRGGVATDTGPGPALYDTGPSAGDFAATRANADPDLADSDVFPRVRADIPETEAKTESRAGRRTRPRAAAGRPVAGTTTMTTTGRAPSGTSSPTSSTGPNCPPTAPWRPRPAPRTPAPPPRRRPQARPARCPAAGVQSPGVPAPASAGRRRRPGRRQPGDRPGRTGGHQGAPRRSRGADTDPAAPTRAALASPTGLGPRRPRNGCRPGTAARLRPTLCRPAPHRTCPRPPSWPAGPGWPGPGRRTAARPGPGPPAPGFPPPGPRPRAPRR